MNTRYLTNAAALVGLTASLFAAPLDSRAAGSKAGFCELARGSGEAVSLLRCDFPGSASDPETSARSFVDAHRGALGMAQGSAELVYLGTRRGLGRQYIRFEQFLAGYPVFDGSLVVVQDRGGRIRGLYNNYNASAVQRHAAGIRKNITRDEAEQIARRAVAREAGASESDLAVRRARQVWFSRADDALALAWELTITASLPAVFVDSLVIVDAATREVLLLQDRREFFVKGAGKVFRPNPIQSSGDKTLTDFSPANVVNGQLVEVTLQGLEPCTGSDCFLKGRFVDVATLQSPNLYKADYPTANEPSRQYKYDLPDVRVAQVMVYHAIDSLQRYLNILGFSDDNTVRNGIRGISDPQPEDPFNIPCTYPSPAGDYCPTRANAHWDLRDQSFYSPTNDALYFGDGGIPDAEDADVIVHEYGHAIQAWQNPRWSCSTGSDCEMRAMGEGFGDFLAASFHAADGNAGYQSANAACVAEWDSTAYSSTDPPCLRRVDGSKIYPTDLQKNICTPNPDPQKPPVCNLPERHKDGEIWSRALWDIRAAIGADVAMQIVLEHHYLLARNSSMPTAARAMIDVDADLFGGVNEAALRGAFCARGILSGADCALPINTRFEVPATKDASVRQDAQNMNDGQSPRLRLTGLEGSKRRMLVGFPQNLNGVNAADVKSAVLELTIADTSQTWGQFGWAVDAHAVPVNLDSWAEGNGVAAGAPESQWNRGTGSGVTWKCPQDTNITDTTTQCSGSSPTAPAWLAGSSIGTPFGRGTAIPPVVLKKGMTGKVRWAVTADLKGGVRSWALKTESGFGGQADFYSIDGAQGQGDTSLAPRLVLTLN